MMKDYIKLTILKISELDIDGSTKPDLSFFLYCTSWGENPQQTQIIKNSLSLNFNTTFQIPINDFKTDTITFKLYDSSKNRTLSSISIQASRIPPGDGYKMLNLIPESYVKNGGKLEIEFQGKDEEYSDSTEIPIPPPLPLSEDSNPSFESLEKAMQAIKSKPSLLNQQEFDKKRENEYSSYSYSDTNSNGKTEKKIIKNDKKKQKNEEYSYYSTDSLVNSPINKQLNEKSSDYDRSAKVTSKKVSCESSNIKSSEKVSAQNHPDVVVKKSDVDEYSYYSDTPKEKSSDYEYYSTDPPESPKSQKNDLSPKTPIKLNSSSIDQFCDSYNYESSTESPVVPLNTTENTSSVKVSDNSSQNFNLETSVDQNKSLPSNDLAVANKDSEQKVKSANFIQKENQNPKKESKKVKSAAVIKRKKAASTKTATKKMIKKEDAAILFKKSKECC